MKNFSFGIDFTEDFLKDYEIIDLLGEGGMGQVYLGIQKSLNRKVAIKFLSGRVVLNERRLGKFRNEARMCAEMRHPNIVELYDFGGGTTAEDRPFMVFELIDGESLADRIKREGKLSVKDALSIGMKVCEGLQYAHEMGIVHRDIKSDNILLSKDGKAKVADFGIAVAAQADEEKTDGDEKQRMIPGTPAYMSPEQAKNEEATVRSDVYSTGIVLYEMLTGRVPFTAETSMAVIIQHISNEAPSICDIAPEVPPQLEDVVLTALEKEQDDRFQSIDEFRLKLKKASTFSKRWKKGQGNSTGTGSFSTSRSISMVTPESSEEKFKRHLSYGFVALMALLMVALPSWFIFGPTAPEVLSSETDSGFTSAVVRFESDRMTEGQVEYWTQGREPKREVVSAKNKQFAVRLRGLKENTSYKYKILLDDGAAEKSGAFETKEVTFSDVNVVPIVNGVHVKWATSLEVQTGGRLLAEGKEVEISGSRNSSTSHDVRLTLSNNVQDIDFDSSKYTIELLATLPDSKGTGFSKSYVIEDFDIINPAITAKIVKTIGVLIQSNESGFDRGFVPEYNSSGLRNLFVSFKKQKELFWLSDDVPPRTRWKFNEMLEALYQFDLLGTMIRSDFKSDASSIGHKSFSIVPKDPYTGGRKWSPEAESLPYKLQWGESNDDLDAASGPVPGSKVTFFFKVPSGGKWTKACIALKHKGFSAFYSPYVSFKTAAVDGIPIGFLSNKLNEKFEVPAGSLYHTFNPNFIPSNKEIEGKITFYPIYPVENKDSDLPSQRIPAIGEITIEDLVIHFTN